MKILHVTPYYFPAWAYGGPPKAVYEIAREQQRLGHEVHILTTVAFEKHKELSAGKFVENGCTIYRLRNFSNYLMWNFHFCTPLKATSFFASQEFDVIHIHEVRTLLTYVALRYGKAKMYCLSPWGTLPYNNSMNRIKKAIDYFLQPLLRQKITLAFGQTNHELTCLNDFEIGKKKLILPLGINIEEFTTLPSRSSARNALDLDQKGFYYLYLGRFSPHKGLDVLLQSFAQLAKKTNHTKLLLAGRDDGYLSEIHRLITKLGLESNVIVLPPLYEKQRIDAYRAANTFVFTPSVYEETGTVCLEALCSGLPVITTFQAEIPSLEPVDGVVHVHNSITAVTTAMETALHVPLHVDVQKVKRLFFWKDISKKVVKAYENCLYVK